MSRRLLSRVAVLPFETLQPLALGDRAPLEKLLALDERLAALAGELTEALFERAGPPSSVADDPGGAAVRGALLKLRRDVHNRRSLHPATIEKARPGLTAALSAGLTRYAELREHGVAREESCRGHVADALDAGRAALLELAATPLFAEGLYLASRPLAFEARRLCERPPRRFRHRDRHLTATLASYAARFCTKTSPAAVFCATAPGRIEGEAAGYRGRPEVSRRDVLLNVAEARKVAEWLAGEDPAAAAVRPRANPTLRRTDGGWTFWKPASFRNETDEEVLSSVKHHPVLAALLESADGRRSAPRLLARVAESHGLPLEALTAFYLRAVASGVLIGEVEIPYNERRPLGFVGEWLGKDDALAVEEAVAALAGADDDDRIARMEQVGKAIEALPHRRALRRDELLRIDAACDLDVTLPESTLAALREGLTPYVRLFSAFYPTALSMAAYAERFLEAFPADADVPLLDLYRSFLDDDTGSERPAAFPAPYGSETRDGNLARATAAMRRVEEELGRRARQTPLDGEIVLDDATVRGWVGDAPLPRWSAGVLFQRSAAGRLVLSGLFNGVGLALARFHRLHGAPVVEELRRAWSLVARPGVVVAEMTYNHIARTANAGLRPRLFEHEIELPGDRASEEATVLPLGELVVRYDSTAGRFGLFDRRDGTEVAPVIGSGVNPLGLVSFLVALGQQHLQYLGLFPGFEVEGVRRWPRIVSGRLVLFRARWIFGEGQWPAVESGSGADHFVETARWRRRHGLPRHVFVHTSLKPKPFYVDLDSPLFTDLLRRTTERLVERGGATLHLTEMLPAPDDLWVVTERGRHATEFLVQLEGPEGLGPSPESRK